MIKPFDYLRSLPEVEHEVLEAISRVLHSNALILGPETEKFEAEFASFLGVKHCIAVTSGTTALHLALLGLGIGPGDEVITVANTCVPTVSAIRLAGASPVFVDVRPDDLMMDVNQVAASVTDRTRCILPVHLWGATVDVAALCALAAKHELEIVEDCAQASGTEFEGKPVGTFGRAGCFSFYPTKNLGAYGDGGAIVTNDDRLAATLRRRRMYGYEGSPVAQEEGMNGRIAEIQAAILRIKLRRFPDWLERRRRVAERYNQSLSNPEIVKPRCHASGRHSYHQYVIRTSDRAELMDHLNQNDIGFGIHYPVPIHTMPAYESMVPSGTRLPVTESACDEILSLPIHEALSPSEVDAVVSAVNAFQAARTI